MRSLEETIQLIKKSAAEAKAKEDAVRANPELAKTPEVKKRYRTNGLIMFILGLAISFATYMGYQETGRILIISFSASLVLVVGGIWMMFTGINPFIGLKKK